MIKNLFILFLLIGFASATYYLPDTNITGDLELAKGHNLTLDDNGTVGGYINAYNATIATTLSAYTLTGLNTISMTGGTANLTSSALIIEDISASDDVDFGDTLDVKGAARTNGLTVNASQTLAVSTADRLTVGGVIVPQEIVLTVPITKGDFAAGELNRTIFIADDAWTISSIEEVHNVAEATATTCTLAIQKMTGTQALSGGINITEAAFSLKSTANTVVTGTLSTTSGRTTLADGNRIGLLCNMTGTNAMDAFRGGCLTIHMKRV